MSGVAVRLMSDGEQSPLKVVRDLDQKRLTTQAAAQLLGLERRQVFRLLKAYGTEGPTGLISKRRGRRSNRRKPKPLRGRWIHRQTTEVVRPDGSRAERFSASAQTIGGFGRLLRPQKAIPPCRGCSKR